MSTWKIQKSNGLTTRFNPWIGCAKVSPGCEHCYAEHLMDTRLGQAEWGVNGTRKRTSKANWKKPVKWNKDAARGYCPNCFGGDSDCNLCHGSREPYRARVFCASLADVFEDREELIPWREDLFELINATPHLDWLILTKRPENVKRLLDDELMPSFYIPGASGESIWDDLWQGRLHNVWLGTSVENQEQADKRIPELLKIPASVRFLSMEPLLGPVEISDYLNDIQWVIVGGESGEGARPMHPEWVWSLRDQCINAGVPFFFKQWGEWLPMDEYSCHKHGMNSAKYESKYLYFDGTTKADSYRPDLPTTVFRVGKKAAGRLLDNREWSNFPRSHHAAH